MPNHHHRPAPDGPDEFGNTWSADAHGNVTVKGSDGSTAHFNLNGSMTGCVSLRSVNLSLYLDESRRSIQLREYLHFQDFEGGCVG